MAEGGQVITCDTEEEVTLNIDKGKKEQKLVMIYFTATWCGPCRFIGPVVFDLAKKYPNVIFLKVDIDELSDAVTTWNIEGMPNFTFVKNGDKIYEMVGAATAPLEAAIKKYSEGSGGTTSTSAI